MNVLLFVKLKKLKKVSLKKLKGVKKNYKIFFKKNVFFTKISNTVPGTSNKPYSYAMLAITYY